jgi:hypothetical protein
LHPKTHPDTAMKRYGYWRDAWKRRDVVASLTSRCRFTPSANAHATQGVLISTLPKLAQHNCAWERPKITKDSVMLLRSLSLEWAQVHVPSSSQQISKKKSHICWAKGTARQSDWGLQLKNQFFRVGTISD